MITQNERTNEVTKSLSTVSQIEKNRLIAWTITLITLILLCLHNSRCNTKKKRNE